MEDLYDLKGLSDSIPELTTEMINQGRYVAWKSDIKACILRTKGLHQLDDRNVVIRDFMSENKILGPKILDETALYFFNSVAATEDRWAKLDYYCSKFEHKSKDNADAYNYVGKSLREYIFEKTKLVRSAYGDISEVNLITKIRAEDRMNPKEAWKFSEDDWSSINR